MLSLKRISGLILVVLVLFLTIVSIMHIWGIIEIDIKNLASKSMTSLSIIFVATLVLLFIFSVLLKGEDHRRPPKINP